MAKPQEIPHIIHQTWKDECISNHSDVAEKSRESWIAHHPNWEYRLWVDSELEGFVENHYPWFLNTYRELNLNIKKIDAVRYCWLHHFGGLYVDLDFVCVKSIEPLIEGASFASYISQGAIDKDWTFAGNAWMASCSGHPIWIRMLEHITQFQAENAESVHAVLRHTGPMGLGKVVKEYVAETGDPTVKIISPDKIGNEDEPPVEYAFHVRTHQWGEDWNQIRHANQIRPRNTNYFQKLKKMVMKFAKG